MIDPYKPLAVLLAGECQNIEAALQRGQQSVPRATVSVIDNNSEVILGGAERFSGIVVQLDVWDNQPTRERCEQTAQAVSARMIAAGFSRQSAPSLEEDHLHRVSMTFRGTVDNKTFMVYERS